jgi:hypothetical protein
LGGSGGGEELTAAGAARGHSRRIPYRSQARSSSMFASL